jgi:hypothetical protein
MAYTQFSSTNDLTVKLWSQRQLYDFVSDTEMLGQMMNSGVIRRYDDTSKQSGDRVRIPYLMRLTGQGLLGNTAATGNEDELTYFTDDLVINQLRYPIAIPAPETIDVQRVLQNLPEDTYRVLSEWHKQRAIVSAFNQLAGNTATTITYDSQNYSGNSLLKITGMNSVVAPTTTSGVTRQIWPNSLTTDQAVAADPTATLKLSFILQCETIAQTSRPYIRPINGENSAEKFHFYVHTEGWNQLMNDTTSPYQYRDLQNAMITSGRGDGEIPDSFLFSSTRVFKSDKLPLGVDSNAGTQVANCRRAVFCGMDAGGIGFGQGYGSGKDSVPGWVIKSDMYDIGQQQRIAMNGMYGIKKVTFNNNDNGTIVVSHYSSI